MLLPIVSLAAGLILLVWSAERFVAGAAVTATNLGVSSLIIGLTIVSIGTSAPEILVAVSASLEAAPKLAIGNAIGSNIANIGLVLGVTAIAAQLPFSQEILKNEVRWLIGATLLAFFCLVNLFLGAMDGLFLLAGLGLILYLMLNKQRSNPQSQGGASGDLSDTPTMPTHKGVLWLIFGLLLLLISAQVVTKAAVEIANQLGVDELIVGLTVIAIGTSLPELAASVTAAVKGHAEIAIGNVIGSNILNILAVLAVPALMHPVAVDSIVIWRDYGVMALLTLILVIFAQLRGAISRLEGALMLCIWIGYNVVLYIQASA
ncbi:MAG: calcium/sodium antiporter [Pseudomonadales bacterium]|nr:calcium/sodium antiporter [Pseudomonadales bacterium]